MKNFFTLLFIAVFYQISNAQQEIYKIDYTVSIDEALKTEIENSEEGSSTSLFLSIMEGLENESVLEAWVGKNQNRIQSTLFEQWIQLRDVNAKTLVRLDTTTKTFVKLDYEGENLYSNKIQDIPNKTMFIAGFPCKLATLEIDSEDENIEPAIIEIWYTEKIPQIVWGEYQYLSQIPGAALRISNGGVTFQAKDITKVLLANNYFDVPSNYTEVDELYSESNENIEDIDLGEGIIAYYDSSSSEFGLKSENGEIITKPKFSSVDPFNNGYTTVLNDDNFVSIINKKGENETDYSFEYISYDPEVKSYIFLKDGKMSLMDHKGKQIWKNSYEYIAPFNQSYSIITEGNYNGIIDKNGEIVVPVSNKSIIVNDSYYYITEENNDFKIYDLKTNKFVFSGYPFLFITNSEDTFKASNDGENYGLINSKGEVILPFEYSYITDFTDGLATAMKTGESEEITINSKGEEIIN